jgi:hypothetical protein
LIERNEDVVSGGNRPDERFGYGAGTYAAGADSHPFRVAGRNRNPDALQIGQPPSSGFIMGVTDIISGDRSLATYFTLLCHFYDSFAVFLKKRDIYNVRLHMASILSGDIANFNDSS